MSWLVAFGVIGSAAVWARQVTGLSLRGLRAIAGCGAPRDLLHSTAPWRDAFRVLIAVGLPIFLLVGLFFLPRIDMLYNYMRLPVMVTSRFGVVHLHLARIVSVRFGPYLFVCIVILATGWLFRLLASGWFYRRLPSRQIWGPARSLWLATATFLFGLSRQIGDARHAVLPGIILMLVGCFWPWRSRPGTKMRGSSFARTQCSGEPHTIFFLHLECFYSSYLPVLRSTPRKRDLHWRPIHRLTSFRKKPCSISWLIR